MPSEPPAEAPARPVARTRATRRPCALASLSPLAQTCVWKVVEAAASLNRTLAGRKCLRVPRPVPRGATDFHGSRHIPAVLPYPRGGELQGQPTEGVQAGR